MNKNKILAAVAAAALVPIIALGGSGIATAAPDETPVPVQVTDTSQPVPVQVEPAMLAAPFTFGLSMLGFPFCFFAVVPTAVAACVTAV